MSYYWRVNQPWTQIPGVRLVPIVEFSSDTPNLVNLGSFEPDDGFGPTPLQEPAGVNRV